MRIFQNVGRTCCHTMRVLVLGYLRYYIQVPEETFVPICWASHCPTKGALQAIIASRLEVIFEAISNKCRQCVDSSFLGLCLSIWSPSKSYDGVVDWGCCRHSNQESMALSGKASSGSFCLVEVSLEAMIAWIQGYLRYSNQIPMEASVRIYWDFHHPYQASFESMSPLPCDFRGWNQETRGVSRPICQDTHHQDAVSLETKQESARVLTQFIVPSHPRLVPDPAIAFGDSADPTAVGLEVIKY